MFPIEAIRIFSLFSKEDEKRERGPKSRSSSSALLCSNWTLANLFILLIEVDFQDEQYLGEKNEKKGRQIIIIIIDIAGDSRLGAYERVCVVRANQMPSNSLAFVQFAICVCAQFRNYSNAKRIFQTEMGV